MNNPIRSALIGLLIALLWACGGEAPSTSQSTNSIEPAAPPVDVIEPASAENVGVEETIPAPNEPVETQDEPIRLAQATPDDTPAAGSPAEWQFSAGQHYTQLASAQGTSSAPGVIEVAEVFWYGCGGCYNFDPIVEKWADNLQDDVAFVRIPVMWNPTNEIHARLFYTALSLGKLEEMHATIFDSYHQKRKPLTSEGQIKELFAAFDVSEEDFDKAYKSFEVETNLRRAKSLTSKYAVASVPTLVVNGKYTAPGPQVKNFGELLRVADELIAKERAAL